MKTVRDWVQAVGAPVSVSRWGDGECLILQGAQGANCDGVQYSSLMRQLLSQAATNREVVKLTTRDSRWRFPFASGGDHATLHDASARGQARPFFSAIRRASNRGSLTIVGPGHLGALPLTFTHVVTHPSDALSQVEEITHRLSSEGPGDVVLFCAGPTSNILIDRLHGRGACLLDVGALLDPYAGVLSRVHQRRARIDVSQIRPVVVSLATQPHRERFAAQVIDHFVKRSSIVPDVVRITFNGFDAVPQWGEPYRSIATENLGAAAKFSGLQDYPGCYWFSVDDDIRYPTDYIQRLLAAHNTHGGAVGVHAGIPPETGPYWSPATKKMHFEQGLPGDVPVTLLGTGTMAILVDDFPDLSMDTFKGNENRTDPVFAVYCRRRSIPMHAVKRHTKWLRSFPGSQNSGKEVWRAMIQNSEVYDQIWTSP